MSKFVLIVALAVAIAGVSCDKGDREEETFAGIEAISFENYPKVDGSTSSSVLNMMVACRLLNLPHEWVEPGIVTEWTLHPKYSEIPGERWRFFEERVKTSQTHGAFVNLIDGNAELILTHRTISPDERARADSLGVALIETPVAVDAFVFVVNKENSVRSLAVDQVRKIYAAGITRWSEVGGSDAAIKVFTRPRNSGSEEVLRELVMKDLEPAIFPESGIGGMSQVFGEVLGNRNAICYTFNNYKNLQARVPDSEVPKIAINGVFPDEQTIKSGAYPFISKVHVAIRSDLDRHSMAYKLYEWLQSAAAHSTIAACGFLPL
ncbi:MAG: substrate-binding domain-containing protein [Odoribacteraceae bacterium]|jgi:phosphate transport system substrate-binding protein|nr:substrate-binding domain-containing protein [Odoribacteraceae bacterium]